MATKIPWVRNPDGTPGEIFNPIIGCTPVSPGCDNCWARRLHGQRYKARWPHGMPECYEKPFSQVRFLEGRLLQPVHWRKPRTVFVCSTSDLCHKDAPMATVFDIFQVMAVAQRHRFLLLTKRPERMAQILSHIGTMPTDGEKLTATWDDGHAIPLPNVALGVTVENADYLGRLGDLLSIPAAMHFVSIEPMLGPVDLSPWLVGKGACRECGMPNATNWHGQHWTEWFDGDGDPQMELCGDVSMGGLDWVICGAESGPHRRPFQEQWARDLRDQCIEAAVPFFYKQGRDAKNKVEHMPLLDGRTWTERPEWFFRGEKQCTSN